MIQTANDPLPQVMDDDFPNVNEEDEGAVDDGLIHDDSPPIGDDATTEDRSAHSIDLDGNNNPLKEIQALADRTYIECKARVDYSFTKEDMASIELLRLLEEARMPLGSYDLIRKWASKWTKEGADFTIMAQHTRQGTVKTLSKKIGYDTLQAVIHQIQLPCAHANYNMPVFSFASQFAAMIADPRLMRHEFLQFNQPDDIMAPPPQHVRGSTYWYTDTNHGDLYRQAHKKVVTGPDVFLVTLMFFSDRTHTDIKGKLTLEPLIFCPTSLFNLKARQNPLFWSVLGYLPYAKN
jgi:hypothetical protein